MNKAEVDFKQRMIYENQHFLAYIPFFTDYPFGLFIVSKNHKSALSDFTREEKRSLAEMLKCMTGAMDTLFDRLFPYMMVIHQRPVHGETVQDFYHFHIEFYTPLRDIGKIKYYASSEMGAWAALNPQAVEDTSEQLRKAFQVYLEQEGRSKECL